LERIARDVIAFFRVRGDLSKLLMEDERRFEARNEELAKRKEVLQRLVEQCLADGIASGVFRVPNVPAAAASFRGMIRTAVESQNPGDTPEGLAAGILEIFIHGVGRRPA
ncbi:MAG TPA: hypothetical protein VIZ58_06375, partial [Thermoanaerobaculia bacterium]